MTEQIQLPAVPTDGELSKEFPSRPYWPLLSQIIEGVTGRALFDDKDFGLYNLELIQKADAQVRDYLKVYDRKGGAYWDTPFGAVEKAGEAFAEVRIGEQNRANNFRACCNAIMTGYTQAHKNAEAEAQRKLEQQQREDAERQRQESIRALQDEIAIAEANGANYGIAEAEMQIQIIKAIPIIPPVVTPQQAAAAANLPAMPKGLVSSKKPIYEHTITDVCKLVAWLNENPSYIAGFTIEPRHITLKNTVFPKESGVETREKRSVQNRGK